MRYFLIKQDLHKALAEIQKLKSMKLEDWDEMDKYC